MFIDILMIFAVIVLCLLVGTMFYVALNGFQAALREMAVQRREEHEQTMTIMGTMLRVLTDAQSSRQNAGPVITEYAPQSDVAVAAEPTVEESVRNTANERLEEETLAASLSKRARSPVSFGAES